MPDKVRRKQLVERFKQAPSDAGVYRIVNVRTGRALLGSSPNLASVLNKLEFARTTGSTGALDHRLRADYRQYGAEAFTLEVLDRLDVKAEMTEAEIRDDLSALEGLWRERFDPATLY